MTQAANPVQTFAPDEPVLTSVPDVLPADHYALQPHPLVPMPTAEEAEKFLARPGGAAELTKLLNDRGQLIYLMETDPFHYGAELEQWRDADMVLAAVQLVYVSGGKRASKSEWAAKRVVEAALTYKDGVIWCFQDNERTSIATQQKLVWKFLPPEIKALNRKQNTVFKINYSLAGGFTERMLVLPNGTAIYFLTYNQVPEEFQGWELGAKVRQLVVKNGRTVQNIGAWPDENLTLKWLETLFFRLSNKSAKMVWTFSTTEGITATIKRFLGTARTLQTRPAELLPDRVNLPNLPVGHMPYLQEPQTANARVIYFFTQWNPFSGYDQPGGVKELCQGKRSPYIMMNAYGYAEDTSSRKFARFGEWNIIKTDNLPEEGTNYMGTDPHGAWNWAALWARVAPGNPSSIYIYRDWPDFKRFGEWAVISDNPRKFDGDKGPAQKRTLGYGPVEYKQLFLREEKILTAPDERDPYRLTVLAQAKVDGVDPDQVQEELRERLIDPRAGRSRHATEKGGTCLIDKLAEVSRDPTTGEIKAPGMNFTAAPGIHISEGEGLINSFLYWDPEKPLMPLLNYPRLFVAENCKQIIWALQNWTGEDGEEGACKAYIDILRYLLTANIRHIAPGRVKTSGGGTY